MVVNSILDLIGNTPLVKFSTDEVDANIYVKMEGFNPTGSIKDRACIANIKNAIETGKLKKGMTILDASSGNMACAISYYGKILGYDTELVCGSKLTLDKKNFIEYFGGKLTVHGDYTIEANRYCRDVIVPQNPEKYCFLDQLHNDNNPKASYETLGPEIYKDLPNIEMIVGSLGSGGSMYGSSKYLKEHNKEILSVTVEASSGYKIPGTGTFIDGDYVTPFIEQGRDEVFDDSISIELPDAQRRTSQLASQGIFVGWQTGGVLDATIQAIKKYNIKGDVVMLSGDSGWKNVEKLMANQKLTVA
jgi:cysteine synthase